MSSLKSSIRARLIAFSAALVLLHVAIMAGGLLSIYRGHAFRERSFRAQDRLESLRALQSLVHVGAQRLAQGEALSEQGVEAVGHELQALQALLGPEPVQAVEEQAHVQAQRQHLTQALEGWQAWRQGRSGSSQPSVEGLQQLLLMPLAEALRAEQREVDGLRERIRSNLRFSGMVALLLPFSAVLFILLWARGVLNPLRLGLGALHDGAERLSRGEHEVQVQISGPSELVELGQAFNHMARELASRTEEARRLAASEAERDALQRHSALLEETVRGRTAALEKSLEQLKRAQDQLQLADRLASVGQLAAGVAHEINNPLAYITSNLRFVGDELKLGRPSSPEERNELVQALQEALEGSQRVAHIVRDLKQFSRGDENDEGPAFLEEVLRSVFKMAAPELRHRTRLVSETTGGGWVRGSSARLGQVFLNLVLNAVQAMPTGRPMDENVVQLHVFRRGEEVWVEIKDTGVGMAPQVRARIFDPFFTTRPVGEGTGLGLAVCHGIVTAVGGRIEVESEVGRGSTFRVALKVAEEPTEEVTSPDLVSNTTVVRERRLVLVVDDEPHVRKALERMLRQHELRFANGGPEALAMLQAEPEIEVVLCDLMMPDMSGMELYARVAQCMPGRERTFLFMTGGGFTLEARAFLESVSNAVVDKPVDPATLGPLVSAIPLWKGRASSEHVAEVDVEPLAPRFR
jgi:two-component system, NtrC family, sensor kinase